MFPNLEYKKLESKNLDKQNLERKSHTYFLRHISRFSSFGIFEIWSYFELSGNSKWGEFEPVSDYNWSMHIKSVFALLSNALSYILGRLDDSE